MLIDCCWWCCDLIYKAKRKWKNKLSLWDCRWREPIEDSSVKRSYRWLGLGIIYYHFNGCGSSRIGNLRVSINLEIFRWVGGLGRVKEVVTNSRPTIRWVLMLWPIVDPLLNGLGRVRVISGGCGLGWWVESVLCSPTRNNLASPCCMMMTAFSDSHSIPCPSSQ